VWPQIELLSDVRSDDPAEPEIIKALVDQCSELFTAVIEHSSHVTSEIERQYGSRPSDPEVHWHFCLDCTISFACKNLKGPLL
jgi:hypothetical protein